METEINSENRENYILPRTEATVNSMIEDIVRGFDTVRLASSVLNLVYLVLRMIFFSPCFVLDLVISALFSVQTVLLVFWYFGKLSSQKMIVVLNRVKMVPTLLMIVIVCLDVFEDVSRMMPWQVLMMVFMGLSWLLLAVGDVFAAFVPVYAKMIFDSFREDIEAKGLLLRCGNEIKEVVKDGVKDAIRVDTPAEAIVKGIGMGLGGPLGFYLAGKLFGKKKGD